MGQGPGQAAHHLGRTGARVHDLDDPAVARLGRSADDPDASPDGRDRGIAHADGQPSDRPEPDPVARREDGPVEPTRRSAGHDDDPAADDDGAEIRPPRGQRSDDRRRSGRRDPLDRGVLGGPPAAEDERGRSKVSGRPVVDRVRETTENGRVAVARRDPEDGRDRARPGRPPATRIEPAGRDGDRPGQGSGEAPRGRRDPQPQTRADRPGSGARSGAGVSGPVDGRPRPVCRRRPGRCRGGGRRTRAEAGRALPTECRDHRG